MSADLLDQLDRHLEPEQITMLATTPPSIAAIFPSTAFVMVGGGLSAGGPLGQFISLRFFVPLSVDRTEVLSFSLVERDAPERFKADIHQTSVGSFGVAGMFEVDDVEVWAGVQRGLHGVIGRQTVGNYQAVGDHGGSDPARPGRNHRGVSTDDNQWLFYQRWLEFLGDGAW
jgi:PAH dioxygenase large subunit